MFIGRYASELAVCRKTVTRLLAFHRRAAVPMLLYCYHADNSHSWPDGATVISACWVWKCPHRRRRLRTARVIRFRCRADDRRVPREPLRLKQRIVNNVHGRTLLARSFVHNSFKTYTEQNIGYNTLIWHNYHTMISHNDIALIDKANAVSFPSYRPEDESSCLFIYLFKPISFSDVCYFRYLCLLFSVFVHINSMYRDKFRLTCVLLYLCKNTVKPTWV